MALLDSESCGFSTTAADYTTYNILTGTAPTIGTSGPIGDNYFSIPGFNATYARPLAASATTFFFGMRVQLYSGDISTFGFQDSVGIVLFFIGITSAGVLTVYAASGAVLGSASTVLSTSSWNYLEIGGVINASTGSVTVKVNGTTVLTLSSVNTKGSSTLGSVGIVYFIQTSINHYSLAWTHMYFCDNTGSAPWNTYLGDVRVQALNPTANSSVAFTPNGLANNYQNAAKNPPVPGTDYNSAGTVGNTDLFVYSTIAASVATVYGINVKSLVAKSDSGARSAANVVKSGGTTSPGSTVTLSTSFMQISTVLQVDPNTSAAWTNSAINAMTAGYKVAA